MNFAYIYQIRYMYQSTNIFVHLQSNTFKLHVHPVLNFIIEVSTEKNKDYSFK